MRSISDLVRDTRAWIQGAASAALLRLSIEVNPVPASRPKVSKWGVYYGKNYAEWIRLAKAQVAAIPAKQIEGPVLVLMEQVVAKPRTSKRDYPVGDVDNYAKGPLDILTGKRDELRKFWKDDDQVVGLLVFKRFAEPTEDPGTHIEIFKL